MKMKMFDKEKKTEKRRLKEEKRNERKRIRRERREARILEKERRKLKKRFHKTVDWIEIDYVADNFISIHNEEQALFGFKIIPPKLALENESAKMAKLSHLVLALNSTDLLIYNDMIFSPIDVSVNIMMLNEQAQKCKDQERKSICSDEIELLEESSMNMRTEYFMLHKCRVSDKKSIQKFDEFFRRIASEGFAVAELNHQDLMNYIAYKFKNEYIYDFYFPRAVFEKLEERNEYLNSSSGEVERNGAV